MKPDNNPDPRSSDHLANERTFLAWLRTSIAIIAFGFVIERFSLFMKQMAFVLGKTGLNNDASLMPAHGYSSVIGILLVAFGTVTSLFGYIKYKQVAVQIDEGRFKHGSWLDLMVTLVVFGVGIVLVIYLTKSL